MTEHYTRNTEYVWKWCERCGRMTEHPVSDSRVGRCKEDHGTKEKPKEAEPETSGNLFQGE